MAMTKTALTIRGRRRRKERPHVYTKDTRGSNEAGTGNSDHLVFIKAQHLSGLKAISTFKRGQLDTAVYSLYGILSTKTSDEIAADYSNNT